ncbi:PREDICTED: beta-adaptin-like protein C isoform X1 [Tarenaya hassleriana]|uniref:beta-adaptin-like protein C isoform X2 n=1 Tax=Tarenaya hassleriana TaxID=28532 RepID=UPI00053C0A92|nr:PREDICTED: beta-adaptin-like protein C isoform X2 [Tarenaya hassleriana]XP_010529611.1 PREDICTED: beta-adaptin-like protein C isoform X3 [Tarenaya hassleriana]XP_019057282.1 PREDICTED: beta-adaptin-like protein C isoform X1 [Tarenaya hassleriana]
MSGHDSKYFSTTKKGEIPELKDELNSQYKDKRKDAVKKVIAAMTVGKDVSSLFTDVVNCMQTENLELKKLVYLYLINYAKSQPDLAILAVNTFVKDSQDPNPLIRALAVRTMGCIRVDKITEYLCDPLQKCLKDDDPYVRKTAAICVAKLYDLNAELVEDRGFLDALKDLISDNNPMVVANAVAALAEIQENSTRPMFEVTSATLTKLLTALNECTEWGQVFILDALSRYKSTDPREAENIVERVTPRLQHANCAVVLSAVKMILQQMELITSTDVIRNLCKKMAPPLVTLLSAEPEIQYVALRNINLIVQKRPTILAHEIKVFFCKYNDPIYVKMEKLEIMIKLASDRNIDQVLLEFKEYATEVDVDFVRKAVRAIGRCAIKLERAAERCISVLLELIKIKVNYVVQEAIIVIKDIFRRYPNTYESIIATLCESLDTLDEPEAKASMIWIIGEYAERIDNADELLESFLESFPEEPPQVQLQLLTATVKLFLKKPTEGPQQMIQVVLNNATVETDNPDLRDRAYIYWRLLSTDPEAAKDVVLAEKPVITDDSNQLDASLLDELLANIATLSSVYHKPPEAFMTRLKTTVQKTEDEDYAEGSEAGYSETSSHPVDGAASPPAAASNVPQDASSRQPAPASVPDLLGDLIGLDNASAIVPSDQPTTPSGPSLPVLLPASTGQGLQISGQLNRRDGQVFYSMLFENNSQIPLDGFMIQFNKNTFGLAAAGPLQIPTLQPGTSARTMLPMVLFQNMSGGPPSLLLQVAVKNNQQPVWYFNDKILLAALFTEDGRMERGNFLETWRSLPDSNEVQKEFQGITISSVESTLDLLAALNMFFIAKRKNGNQDVLYLSAKLPRGVPFLIELTAFVGNQGLKCAVKTPSPEMAPLFFESLEHILLNA